MLSVTGLDYSPSALLHFLARCTRPWAGFAGGRQQGAVPEQVPFPEGAIPLCVGLRAVGVV